MTVMRLLVALAVLAMGSMAVPEPRIAFASIVRPCQDALQGAQRDGDARWIERCANWKRDRGLREFDAARECRDWLAMCRKDPRHPSSGGINSF